MVYEFSLTDHESFNGIILSQVPETTYKLEKIPEKGAILINTMGQWSYKPYINESGPDSFKIIASQNSEQKIIEVKINITKEAKNEIDNIIYLENILRIDEKYLEKIDNNKIQVSLDNINMYNYEQDLIISGCVNYILGETTKFGDIYSFSDQYLNKFKKVVVSNNNKIVKDFVISKQYATKDCVKIVLLKEDFDISKIASDLIYCKIPIEILE